MTMPVRSLPVLQNWDCSVCGACCRAYHVHVTPAEQARIEGQGWESDPDLAGVPYFVKESGLLSGGGYRLNHRPDGTCVFLGADNRCRIHGKFGSAAKPLACRIYPFVFIPAGDHWRVGMRFACPNVAGNKGRPVADQLADAREYVAAVEADSPAAVNGPPIPLAAGRVVPWADVYRIVAAVSKLLANTTVPLELRWRTVLGLVGLCRGLKFDGDGDPKKAVTGGRLAEMLHLLGQAAFEEAPSEASEVPRAGWVGRVVFRQVAAVYARRDHGPEKGPALKTPLSRVLAAMRFARGGGRVPQTHAKIPEVATFEAAEQPLGTLGQESDELLTRYYRVKVESGQFCGPSNFGVPFWEGIESLAVTFPVVMWLARVLVAGGLGRDEAVFGAVRIVDDNFGHNRLLGLGRQKFALRLLAARGELPKLVAWYGR